MKRIFNLFFVFSIALLFFSACKTDGFSKSELSLIQSESSNAILPLFTINVKSDSILLRNEARSIKKKYIGSETLEHLRKRMYATVIDSLNGGVGIAAPQIGIGVKMIYVQRFDKKGEPFEVYYNAKIEEYGDSINSGREGCLSVPNYQGYVSRSQDIAISYLDSVGHFNREKINDFTAVIFQHEIDHIQGVLYYDHIVNGYEALTYKNEF
ncbi:MAG: peptide deformylase [Prolixibacteraceae bacterium]|jgi:peptide deformylase|nr:peptide deformylase [Prolixibacteraceae bacterium]